MTAAPDDAFPTVDRPVASVQKLASAALCLLALVSSAYAALAGVWVVAILFLVGRALAVQSYSVVDDGPLSERY